MDLLPDKIDIKASLQTQDDRKFHELSGYLIISRKLKCFDDNIIKILIPIFAFQGYMLGLRTVEISAKSERFIEQRWSWLTCNES